MQGWLNILDNFKHQFDFIPALFYDNKAPQRNFSATYWKKLEEKREIQANDLLVEANDYLCGLFEIANLCLISCFTIDLILSFREPFKPQKSRIWVYVGVTALMVIFFSNKVESMLLTDS